ncbi:MAG: YceI family protein [Solirubrobacterales bacterium]|nr:YceI family protein [Solirubrobacterales bacterium]
MSTSATISPPAARDALVPPGSWQVSEESEIGFAIKGLGRTVKGRFGSFSGRVVHGTADAVTASGSVEVASIDTGIGKRDDHLRSADFFDAANYPEITFASRRIIADRDRYDIPGTLTIKGVSQDVSLIGRLLPPAPGDDIHTIRIAAEATINRHGFGVKAPERVELFGLAAGARVKIRLLIVAVSDDRPAID